MLTDDLTDDIAAARNRYRWPGIHRRPSTVRYGVRRGFFAGTAAGTGLVVAAIAFPMSAAQTNTAMFVVPPAIVESEADHTFSDPTQGCPACVDDPLPTPLPGEPTQAGPENPDPIRIEPAPVIEVRHRAIESDTPVSAPPIPPSKPESPAEPPEEVILPTTEPEPQPTEDPVPPQPPAPTEEPAPEPTPEPDRHNHTTRQPGRPYGGTRAASDATSDNGTRRPGSVRGGRHR